MSEVKTNRIGKAGFVLALISIFLGWLPGLGWMIWVSGLVFSFIGLLKAPTGFPIAGFFLSALALLLVIALYMVFDLQAGLLLL
jgi:hypothetical protein